MAVKLVVALSLAIAVMAATTAAEAANVLDLIEWDDAKKVFDLPELRNEQNNKNCMCRGPACVCCVDFNITVVDLGGPGCVHMKYLSPEEGFSVNVSYGGSNLIHSSKLQGANPAPICLNVFSKFAQVCAKFRDLAPTADGLRGCLQLEPRLFGEAQLDFPIGCFKSSAGGMEMEEPSAETETDDGPEDNNESEDGGFDAETFLLGVYQTAEQGVAFLSSLLDLPNKLNSTRPTSGNVSTTPKPSDSSETPDVQSRGAKSLKHPNQL